MLRNDQRTYCSRSHNRSGFTLIELLIVIAAIAVLSSMVLFTLRDARESAKRGRAESQVKRIESMILARWEEYEGRQIPVALPAGSDAFFARWVRMYALRDYQRMEMPDRITDVIRGPAPIPRPPQPAYQNVIMPIIPQPSLHLRYQRIAARNGITNWTPQHQGSECLYMILESMQTDLGNGLEFLSPGEIGDTDGDNFLEVLDSWGNPIEFIRWAPGFESPAQTHSINAPQFVDQTDEPNPYDPFRVDLRWNPNVFPNGRDRPYAFTPVISSAGPDGEQGLFLRYEFNNQPIDQTALPGGGVLDPYFYFDEISGLFVPDEPWAYQDPNGNVLRMQLGWRMKRVDGRLPFADNIDNHYGINQ